MDDIIIQSNQNNIKHQINHFRKSYLSWSEKCVMNKTDSANYVSSSMDFDELPTDKDDKSITVNFSSDDKTICINAEPNYKVNPNYLTMQKEIIQQTNQLKQQTKTLLNKLDVHYQILKSNTQPLQRYIDDFEAIKSKFDNLHNELFILNKNRIIFEINKTGNDMKDLKIVKQKINDINDLILNLNDISIIYTEIENMTQKKFADFTKLSIIQDINYLNKHVDIKSEFSNYLLQHKLKIEQSIQQLNQTINLNDLLINIRQNDYYWNLFLHQYNLMTGQIDSMTIFEIYDALKQIDPEIKQELLRINEKINQENYIAEQLEYVKQKWEKQDFVLYPYDTTLTIINNYDFIFDLCLDSISILSNCKNIKISPNLDNQLKEQENTIQNIHLTSAQLKKMQQFILNHYGFFVSDNFEVKRELREECDRFNHCFSIFHGIIRKIKLNQNINEFIVKMKWHESVNTQLNIIGCEFEIISKGVSRFLKSLRENFGRFQFIGDEDLLELCSGIRKPEMINKHINKIFPNINSIRYTTNSKSSSHIINSVTCINNEQIDLQHCPIFIDNNLSSNYSLIAIFENLENSIKLSLRKCLQNYYKDFIEDALQILMDINDNNFQIIDRIYSQILLLLFQLYWTNALEKAIINGTLNEMLFNYQKLLNILCITISRYNLKITTKTKLEILIYEASYQMSIIDYLIQKKVKNLTNPCWIELLRFYVVNSYGDYVKTIGMSENQLSDISIELCYTKWKYGFEVCCLLPESYLVRTQLVDKCFLSIADAHNVNMGSLLFGPAGTGKTESIKHLARYLGRNVYVYNCGDSFSENSFKRILQGASQIGAWICFDEFNRMPQKSVMAALGFIEKIQDNLSASRYVRLTDNQLNEKSKNSTILLSSDQFKVDENTLILLTLNLDYAGRYKLPNCVYKFFRPFSMSVPDSEAITNVILHVKGFHNSTILSTRLIKFFENCQKIIPNEIHYDFGLRSLKRVISLAGRFKKSNEEDLESSSLEMETISILRSIDTYLYPRLLSNDINKFIQLKCESFLLFYNKEMETMSGRFDDNLDNVFNSYTDNSQIDLLNTSLAANSFTLKQKQLYRLLHHNDCIIIFGKVGCGKSQMWRSLMDTLNKKEMIERKRYRKPSINRIVINPSNLNQSTLIGYFDSTTKNWVDGILPTIFRRIKTHISADNNKLKSKYSDLTSTKQYWIIFDGPIQSEWTESLNTLLDNTKSLTLPNGERLEYPISNDINHKCQVKIIMEANSTDKDELELSVTESTISRVAVLYLDEHSITIEDIIKKGVDRVLIAALKRPTEIQGDLEAKVKLLQHNLLEFFNYPKQSILHKIAEFCALTNYTKHTILSPVCRRFKTFFNYLANIAIDLINSLPKLNNKLYQTSDLFYYLIIHGIIFTIASDLPTESLSLISRIIIRSYPKYCPTTNEEAFFNYMLNKKGEWINMTDEACKEIEKLDQFRVNIESLITSQLIIPTQETVRMELYLDYSTKYGEPVIFCGPPGTGKSMTIKKYTEKHDQLKLITLNFNCYTSPSTIIKLFDDHCNYSNPLLTGDSEFGIETVELISKYPNQPQLLIFYDEINMKQHTPLLTNQLQSFLKELFEYKSFYHPVKKLKVLLTTNITLVGACNPVNNTSGRTKLPAQLLHHCTSFVHVNNPSKLFYTNIYEKIISTIFKDTQFTELLSEDLKNNEILITDIIQKSISNYFQIRNLILQKNYPYFVLTLRDFTRWISKFLVGICSKISLTKSSIWEYWSSIGYHVFGDRFAEAECNELIKSIIYSDKYVSMVDSEGQNKDPNKLYLIDVESANKWILKRLEMTIKGHNFVITNHLLDQTMKIFSAVTCGLCSQNVILIGEHGTSKEWCTMIMSKLSNTKLVNINPHANYTITEFSLDLRNIVKLSILEMRKVIIQIKYRDHALWDIIERINPLITNGDGLFLFDELEQTMIINKLKQNGKLLSNDCKEPSSINTDNSGDQQLFMKWFIEYVKFVIIIPKKLFNKEDRIINSHAFFNRCQVIWCNTLNEQNVDSIAETTLNSIVKRIKAEKNDTENLDVIKYITNNQPKLVQIINCINKLGKEKYKAFNANSPSDLYKFSQAFQTIMCIIYPSFTKKKVKLTQICKVLKESIDQLQFLEDSFCEYQQQLKQINRDSVKKLKAIEIRRERAKKLREKRQLTHNDLENQENEISAKKKYLQHTIKRQEKDLIEAKQDLQNLERKQIIELKSMRHPPDAVRVTCELICELLEENTSDWNSILSTMVRDNFVSRILNFDIRNMRPKTRSRIVKKYLKNNIYTESNVFRASMSICPIFKWAKAQLNFGETYDAIQPLRETWSNLKMENRSNRKEMNHNQVKLESLEDEIIELEKENDVVKSKIEEYQNDLEKIEEKIKNAQKIIPLFRQLNDRWEIKLQDLTNGPNSIWTETLVLSAILIYGGHLSLSERQMFLDDIKQEMGSTCDIASKLNMKYVYQLLLDKILPEEYRSAIKYKSLSNMNELFLVLSKMLNIPTLLLYSDNFQVKKRNSHLMNYDELSFCSDRFVESLKCSLKTNNSGVIIYDVEHYKPFIYSLLNRYDDIITIDDDTFQMPNDFQIILVSNNGNWKPPEDWISHVTVINLIDYEAQIQEKALYYFHSLTTSSNISTTTQTYQIGDIWENVNSLRELNAKEDIMYDWDLEYKVEGWENKLINYLIDESNNLLSEENIIVNVEKFEEEISKLTDTKLLHDKTQCLLNNLEQEYSKTLNVINKLIQIVCQFELIPEYTEKYGIANRLWLIIKQTIPCMGEEGKLDAYTARTIVVNFWNHLSHMKINSGTQLKVQLCLGYVFDTVVHNCQSNFQKELWRFSMLNLSSENNSFSEFLKFLIHLFHTHNINYETSLLDPQSSLFMKWLNSNVQINSSKSHYEELKIQLSPVLQTNNLDLFLIACSTICDRSSLPILVDNMFYNIINPVKLTQQKISPIIHITDTNDTTIQHTDPAQHSQLLTTKKINRRSSITAQPFTDTLSDWLIENQQENYRVNQNIGSNNFVLTLVVMNHEPININELLLHYRSNSNKSITIFKMDIDDFIDLNKLSGLILSLLTNCSKSSEAWLYVEGLSHLLIDTTNKLPDDSMKHYSTFTKRLEQENLNKTITASMSLLEKELRQSLLKNQVLKVIFPMNLMEIDEIITDSIEDNKVTRKLEISNDNIPKYKLQNYLLLINNKQNGKYHYELPDYFVKNSSLLSINKRICYLNQMQQNIPLLINHINSIGQLTLQGGYDKSVHYHIGLLLLLFHSLLTTRQHIQQKHMWKFSSTRQPQSTENSATNVPVHLANVPVYTVSELLSAFQLVDPICKNKRIDFKEINVSSSKMYQTVTSDSEYSDNNFKSFSEQVNFEEKLMIKRQKFITINQVKKRLRSILLKSHYGGRLSNNEEICNVKLLFDTVFNIQNSKKSENSLLFSCFAPTKIPWNYDLKTIKEWITNFVGGIE